MTVSPDVDAENALRVSGSGVHGHRAPVEHAIAAGRRGEDVPEELDVATLGEITEEEWRAYWPTATEPAPDDPSRACRRSPTRRSEARAGAEEVKAPRQSERCGGR